MTKNKTSSVSVGDDLDIEEKVVTPEVVDEEEPGTVPDGDGDEDEELLDTEEVDPFHDKWEE